MPERHGFSVLRAGRLAAVLLLALALWAPTAGAQPRGEEVPELPVLPAPQEMHLSGEELVLPETLRCRVTDEELQPLIEVIDYEYHMLTGGGVAPVAPSDEAHCRLTIEDSLDAQAYRLDIDDGIALTGGSYQAVAMGTAALMQLLRPAAGEAHVPRGTIRDRPDSRYRGLLIDVARNWHDVSVLEQLIRLCRWYRVNYLQLHLTDDESFTFPTEAFPDLPTPERRYTKEELRELDAFARRHGVTLVPELEVPGHAGQFVERQPELFAVEGPERGNTINMGREGVYEALDEILGEIAEAFETSPYIHIGADEANLEPLEGDPDVERYLEAYDLPNVEELYRHFLGRMNELVKKHGKETIVWEGFRKEGEVEIPRDITVMAWETLYQLPQDLLAGGYEIINVSWKPLYVVNDRKWPVAYIYEDWNLYRWENWLERAPSYELIQLEPSEQIIGASMASWAQEQHLELPTLRRRLAAMSESAWNATVEPEHPTPAFLEALDRTDAALQEILSPVTIQAEGLRYPDLGEGRQNEQYWFGDTLRLALEAASNQVIYYTTDGHAPSPEAAERYDGPVTLRESTPFKARAFTPEGAPVGYARHREYELHPIEAEVSGPLEIPLSELWKTDHPRQAPFTDTLTIRLSSLREGGTIRYTTDDTEPTPSAPVYAEPITITESTVVRAQLFSEAGEPVGHPWTQHFRKVEHTSSED